jgi:hypothetical protein
MFMGAVPLLGAIAQIATTSVLAWAYAKYDIDIHDASCTMHAAPCTMHHAPCTILTRVLPRYDIDPRWPAVCSYLLCASLGVACFTLSHSIYAFMVYYCLYRSLYSPAIMWKTISFCMVIDEDSHRWGHDS